MRLAKVLSNAENWLYYWIKTVLCYNICCYYDIYEGFHTFSLKWTEDEYVFYVDDKETWRTSAGGVSQAPAYLKITAEVGDWAGNITNAQLPDYIMAYYVRVYQFDEYMK